MRHAKGMGRSEIFQNGDQDERIRLLAKEVIESALVDVTQKRDKLLRRETQRWFEAKEMHPFGYGWTLGVSGYNGNQIAKYLRSIKI